MPEDYVDIGERVTSVTDAVNTRHSIRHYSTQSVSDEVLARVLAKALRSPSWKNSQPWEVHVVSGSVQARLAERMVAEAQSGKPPRPETPWTENYPSDVRKRMFDNGMRVYGAAGIDRKDKEARDGFMLRNFEFFGAPRALFLSTRQDLSFWTAIDLGVFLGNLMLLLREEGLGSCPQAALGAYPDIVRSELGLPAEQKIICGMSLGYPETESDLNRYHTRRESLEDLVKFYE